LRGLSLPKYWYTR
jgi:hypothetical protein